MFGVVVVLFLLLLLLNEVMKRTTFRKLVYRRELSSEAVEVGEEFKITTILENRDILPMPFLHVVERVPMQLRFLSDKEVVDTRSDKTHEFITYLLPNQSVKREYTATIGTRGRYLFRDVYLYGGDFLGSSTVEKSIEDEQDIVVYPKTLDLDTAFEPFGSFYGDISVNRWIINDPILSAGIREYTGNEPQKNIHWASSLSNGKLMVKNFDFTTDNRVIIILNIETHRPFCLNVNAEEIERCISATRAVMEKFEAEGIPYGFSSNIIPRVIADGKGDILPGRGAPHFYGILDLLGRAEYHIWTNLEEILGQLQCGTDSFETYVLITPTLLDEYVPPINMLSRKVSKMILITMRDENLTKLEKSVRILVGKENQ